MSKSPTGSIRLRGVRHNNLKNFDLDLPLNQLIVVTGLSGSGKSSLAFDTLFAEGQRRYIETFSPYARQFFDRMDKPRVDSIEGIPPAIAVEQRNTVKTTRSTVGTMTEICDYMKLLWPHLAQLYCRECGRPVRKDSPRRIWEALSGAGGGTRNTERLITFDLPLAEKLSTEESLGLIARQGYQRLLLPAGNGARQAASGPRVGLNEEIAPWGSQPGIVRVDEAVESVRGLRLKSLAVIQDRIKLVPENRSRFIEACEQAYHFGKGRLAVHHVDQGPGTGGPERFSNRLHCASCDIEYREPSAALFSFNHPLGACPACRGFGRVISIDYDLAIPDRSRSLAVGAVKPWQSGVSAECQDDLMKFCRVRKVPTGVPFEKLPKKWRDWVVEGDPDYDSNDPKRSWPRAWYGVKGYFRWLESKAYKMHVRVLLSRYRAYTPCPDCKGRRFQPEALLYRAGVTGFTSSPAPSPEEARNKAGRRAAEKSTADMETSLSKANGLTLADFYQLTIRDALHLIEGIASGHQTKASDPVGLVLNEVRSRLGYLAEVGLGYLTLGRPTRTLSGGETERVSLTTCLGTRLVNTLYVLDEPSVGLHPRDTNRLIKILEQLRDLGNTVVVVEHEASVIRAADRIVDLGPGHGESGGHLVFQGTGSEILKAKESLTGQYLSGRRQINIPRRRPTAVAAGFSPRRDQPELRQRDLKAATTAPNTSTMTLVHAARHNLKDLAIEIPLGRFVCVTGVSGSGKTTLVREVLLPALEARLKSRSAGTEAAAKTSEHIDDEDEKEEAGNPPRDTEHAQLTGYEPLGAVVLVDQSPLGKTPRSNPAVYIGAFDDIRELFAQTDAAKQHGLNASAFSFNSRQGQCERCRGAGFEKIEMQFLSDVFIRCPDCEGRRYRPHILEVKVSSPASRVSDAPGRSRLKNLRPETQDPNPAAAWSIADLLDATVDEVVGFLGGFPGSRPAERAAQRLELLQEVGLGYLRLGQPINTLSGGESQRLKLVSHLAEAESQAGRGVLTAPRSTPKIAPAGGPLTTSGPALFLFDEPTTGLHFDDVRVLLKVFQRLVDAGHSVLVIEHNLDVIKCADWVIDLGPGAGDEGGQLVAQGTPEDIAACEASHTGQFLRELLEKTHATRLRFNEIKQATRNVAVGSNGKVAG